MIILNCFITPLSGGFSWFLPLDQVSSAGSGFFRWIRFLPVLVIPSVFANDLENFTLYAHSSFTIDDRCRISGDGPTVIGSGGPLMVKIDDTLFSDLESSGDATVMDRSVVNGNMFSGGSVYRINNPVVNGYVREGMIVETQTIPSATVSPGSTDRTAYANETLDLTPGAYRDIVLNGNSRLRLHGGTYQFRKIIAWSNVSIQLDASGGDVTVMVADELNLGDRITMEPVAGYLNPQKIQWYTNQSAAVFLGTDCYLAGTFTVPHTTVKIGARTIFKGRMFAEAIILDPDVKVESVTDTRYVDSDFDDVPDIVENELGTNPVDRNSTPKVAQPSSWYGDASRDVVVYYDLSMFPKYFSHTHVPITIPAGVNDRVYNPIVSILEPEEIGVTLALPPGNKLQAAYHIKVGIAPGTTLLLGFPLPGAGIDLNYVKTGQYLLQHYNDSAGIWETVAISHIENNVVYAAVSSNQRFTISAVPLGLNTINDLRVFVLEDATAVLEEKNYADVNNDIEITDAQRLEKISYSLNQFRTIMPQMRYSYVTHQGLANLQLYWVENAVALSDESCLRFETALGSGIFAVGQWVAGLSFLHDAWENPPDFNKVTICPGVPNRPSANAREDNTIWFNPHMNYYSLDGNLFVAREEIYDEWNRNLREEIYRRDFIDERNQGTVEILNRITGNPVHPENDVFHPAGNELAGADLTWVIKHELGHCLGLGSDNQQSRFIDPAVSGVDPDPAGGCPACACIAANLCRPIIDEWEGSICYEEGFPKRAQYYNNNMMREFDARDLVANTDFVVSYPYIRMFVRMQNRGGDRYNSTNWYDVRYRMLETPFTIGAADNNPERFFVMGLDSVVVSTEVGQVYANGLCIDQTNGDVYFGDYARIMRLSANGTVLTFAGTGISGYQNGPAATAQFHGDFCAPFCRDNAGAVYVCERNVNRIRKISGGNVSLFAGSDAGTQGFIDGTGSAARFNWPSSMCIDAANNIYVADYNNHRIRRITPAGVVTTLAGTGTAGNVNGSFAVAQFNYPCGIAIDAAGNLYVTDRVSVDIRLLDMGTNTVTTFAGNGTSAHVDGPAGTASFIAISDLHVDPRGIVYVVDDDMIRMVRDGVVSTIAGRTGDPVPYRDGCGTDARFRGANDVCADARGNLYVTESLHTTLRKLNSHVPVTINAPLVGARVEDGEDEVWFEFTVTDNLDYTVTVTPDALLLGSGAVPVPAPSTVGVDAELFGPDNEYLPVLNGSETDGDGVSIAKTLATGCLATGRYLLRVYAHNAAYASGAFSVRVSNENEEVLLPPAAGNVATVPGNLEGEGDNDWFWIDVPVASTLTIETENRSAGLATEPIIYIYRDSEGLPVGGVPRLSTPIGVGAVPGVTEDDVDLTRRIPLIRRLLRNGRTLISRLVFGGNPDNDNRINGYGIYWIRVRAAGTSETGTYTLRVTRN
ncbi:MAG: hypothetical protein JW863_02140 [Chitinispirillaceae bacterium]|nr:hypothetical protein [Chitinispirillaceae bacterium]